MKKINLYKGAGVLLITALLIFSTVAVTADTKDTPKISSDTTHTVPNVIGEDIVWDNIMDYDGLAAAQYDPAALDAYQADDFYFEVDTDVNDVHWIGGYWNTNYQQGAFDWCISFYVDDGTGTAPSGHPQTPSYAGPFCFAWNDIGKELIQDTGTSIYYRLSVILPETLTFTGSEKYWISIWGEGAFPPQSGWGYHQIPITLNPAVWGSDYFVLPFWTPGFDVLGYDHDMCFQLTYDEAPPPEPAICCEGEIEWTDVKPGDTVTATFEVCNCGEEGSFLNWEICGEPEWGENWTFDPASGTGLAYDECVEVEVSVEAPEEENEEFEGEIEACNSDDPDDTCTVPVRLVTPCDLPVFLELILQRFPILRQILLQLFL